MDNKTPTVDYVTYRGVTVQRRYRRGRLFAIGCAIGAALYIVPTLV